MKFGGLYKFGFPSNSKKMVASKTKRKRHTSVLQIMSELGSESNAHGLAKIATSSNTRRKVMWAILVIIGFTAATLQLSLLVGKFLSYQVVEVSNMKDGMPVEFPSVTVCNIATISLTKVNGYMNSNESSIGKDMLKWFTFVSETDFGEQDLRMDSHQAFYENLPKEAKAIGHDIKNLIIHCRFNQKECGPANFTLYFDGKNYYNCYTFNSGYDFVNDRPQQEKVLMHTTGPQNGLSLIISLDNEDSEIGSYGVYDVKNHIAYSAGVRAQVHAPNTMPSPADHGFDIPPGYSSSVGLKAILHSRLPFPHGNCTDDNLHGDRTYRNTIFSCLQLCKQKILIKMCQCKTSALPMFNESIEELKNIPFCGSIKNWKTKAPLFMKKKQKVELPPLTCEQRLLDSLANDRSYEKSCKCFQPCKETSYQKSLSLSYWPLEFYHYHALQEFYKDNGFSTKFMKEAYEKLLSIDERYGPSLQEQKPKKANQSDLDDIVIVSKRIRQNLLRLNIYLEDLSIVEFTQMPAYDLADLFADIGGTLGLWMGISVLTIMELIELIIRLVMLFFNSESDISGTDYDSNDEPVSSTPQTVLDHNNVPHQTINKYDSKYEQFQYDRPLFQQSRYDKHAESPI